MKRKGLSASPTPVEAIEDVWRALGQVQGAAQASKITVRRHGAHRGDGEARPKFVWRKEHSMVKARLGLRSDDMTAADIPGSCLALSLGQLN